MIAPWAFDPFTFESEPQLIPLNRQEGQPKSEHRHRHKHPHTDLFETQDQVILEVDLPGVKKDSIDIEIHGHLLTLKCHRKIELDAANVKFHIHERMDANIKRQIQLPEFTDIDDHKESLEDGVLKVVFGRKKEQPARQISIM